MNITITADEQINILFIKVRPSTKKFIRVPSDNIRNYQTNIQNMA
jgi:hypothetical protein